MWLRGDPADRLEWVSYCCPEPLCSVYLDTTNSQRASHFVRFIFRQ
jgi:hypothetical protein